MKKCEFSHRLANALTHNLWMKMCVQNPQRKLHISRSYFSQWERNQIEQSTEFLKNISKQFCLWINLINVYRVFWLAFQSFVNSRLASRHQIQIKLLRNDHRPTACDLTFGKKPYKLHAVPSSTEWRLRSKRNEQNNTKDTSDVLSITFISIKKINYYYDSNWSRLCAHCTSDIAHRTSNVLARFWLICFFPSSCYYYC